MLTGEAAGRSPELDRLVMTCLAADADERPGLKEIATCLEDLLDLPEASRRYSRSIP